MDNDAKKQSSLSNKSKRESPLFDQSVPIFGPLANSSFNNNINSPFVSSNFAIPNKLNTPDPSVDNLADKTNSYIAQSRGSSSSGSQDQQKKKKISETNILNNEDRSFLSKSDDSLEDLDKNNNTSKTSIIDKEETKGVVEEEPKGVVEEEHNLNIMKGSQLADDQSNKFEDTNAVDASAPRVAANKDVNKKTDKQSQQQEVSSAYKKIVGEPIKILEIDPESKKIVFNENELREIFIRNDALNKAICVCSIAGDFRKGKSFLLNYCLRFLTNNNDYLNKTSEINKEWPGNVDEPLVGFGWRSGCDLETKGIWIWSELFSCKVPKNLNILKTSSSNLDSIVNSKENQEVKQDDKEEEYEDGFICLLDSQGAFDERSTVDGNII